MDIVDSKPPTAPQPPTAIRASKHGKCKIIIVVLFAVGVALIVTSIFCEKLFESILKKKLVLNKGNVAYDTWKESPVPVYMIYHIFNYTNVDEIVNKFAIPKVSQVGPFVYREVRINEITDYNEYNITYLQNYSYVFEPSMSCAKCKEDAQIWAPNIAMISALDLVYNALKDHRYIQIGTKLLIDGFFLANPGTTLFKKLKVDDVLWGYEDRLLDRVVNIETILSDFGIQLPAVDNWIKIQFNGTEGSHFFGNTTILTGKENINDVQKVVRWRGLDHAPFWNKNKYAEMFNGSDGSHVRPLIKRGEKIYSFINQICRSVSMEYEKDISYIQDIPMYRYTTKLFPRSEGKEFCGKGPCIQGVLPLAECSMNKLLPPLFLSSPHFYEADPILVEQVHGLKPNKDLHGMIADFEPITGGLMHARKRTQVNILARKFWLSKSMSFRNKLNFLPIFMLDESVTIDKPNANKLKKMVLTPKQMIVYGGLALLVIGILMLIAAIILAVKLWRQCRGGDTSGINMSTSWLQCLYEAGINLRRKNNHRGAKELVTCTSTCEDDVQLKEVVVQGPDFNFVDKAAMYEGMSAAVILAEEKGEKAI